MNTLMSKVSLYSLCVRYPCINTTPRRTDKVAWEAVTSTSAGASAPAPDEGLPAGRASLIAPRPQGTVSPEPLNLIREITVDAK